MEGLPILESAYRACGGRKEAAWTTSTEGGGDSCSLEEGEGNDQLGERKGHLRNFMVSYTEDFREPGVSIGPWKFEGEETGSSKIPSPGQDFLDKASRRVVRYDSKNFRDSLLEKTSPRW